MWYNLAFCFRGGKKDIRFILHCFLLNCTFKNWLYKIDWKIGISKTCIKFRITGSLVSKFFAFIYSIYRINYRYIIKLSRMMVVWNLYIYNSSMYSFSINQNRYDFKSFLVVGDLFHFKLFLALLAATSLMKFLFEDDYYHQQQEVFFLSSFLFANLSDFALY